MAASPAEWLPWSCCKLGFLGFDGVGICACQASLLAPATEAAKDCYADQLVYRTEGALITVLLSLLVMTGGGCALGASRMNEVGKFMAVFFLAAGFLLVSNSIFSTFGTVATSAAAVFLALQAVLLIDLGYSWNEKWYANAKLAKRRLDDGKHKLWIGLILAGSVVFGLGALAWSAHLYITVDNNAGQVIHVTAVLLCLVALFISITDWCEHGALFTSCIVLAYTVWLISQMLDELPDDELLPRKHRKPSGSPWWLGLCVCAVSLVATAEGAGLRRANEEALPSSGYAQVEDGKRGGDATAALAAATIAAANPNRVSAADAKDFAYQCLIHVAAAIYIASELAPKSGSTPFAFYAVAVLASPLIYLWTLVAPKVLSGRDFS